MRLTNFQADPIEKQGKITKCLHKGAKKNSVLTAVTYAHENTIMMEMGAGGRRGDEQIKMGRVHFCSLVNHNDVVGLQLEKSGQPHSQAVLYADATQKPEKHFNLSIVSRLKLDDAWNVKDLILVTFRYFNVSHLHNSLHFK